ncbi:MAG: hypothetical protein JSS52_11220 [Proteobacteria bacterium]|nr:hypothetical protein [Pseudomonadota bacterium]
MSDYTPTTALVRHNWGAYGAPREEFDRWLAAHDAEVRASVLADQGEPEWGWQYGREAMFVKDGSRYDDDLRFDSEETR